MKAETALHYQIAAASVVAMLLLAALFYLMGVNLSLATVAGVVVLLLQLALAWRWRTLNRADSLAPVNDRLGAANQITIGRGVINAALLAWVVTPAGGGWLPAILYTGATLLDLLDGYVARVTGNPTLLGARLDVEYDTLGLLLAISIAFRDGKLPLWYLAVGLARYLYLLLLTFGAEQRPLTASWRRRLWAGLNMAFVGVALWPNVDPVFSRQAALFFGLPLLAGFVRDYLVAAGRLDPTIERYEALRFWLLVVLERWLPLYARLAISYLLIDGRLPIGILLLPALTAILGIAPRVSAILLIAMAVFGVDGDLTARALLASALIVLLLGGGPYALWRPETALFEKRLG